jgi:hypothetical protein
MHYDQKLRVYLQMIYLIILLILEISYIDYIVIINKRETKKNIRNSSNEDEKRRVAIGQGETKGRESLI